MLAITIIGFAVILIWLICLTVRNSTLKQELEKSKKELEGLNLKDNLQELSRRISRNDLHYGLIERLEGRLDEQSEAIKSLQEHKNTLKQFVMDCLIEFEGKLK